MEVDGITVARANQIENGSVVSGRVVPATGRLMLTKKSGEEIDAGLVAVQVRNIQTFTANGTWTKPLGCTRVQALLYGAGAGGCGHSYPSLGANSYRVAGAGAFINVMFRAEQLNATEPVVVGQGGAGGSNAARGGDGGDSKFSRYTAGGGTVGDSGTPKRDEFPIGIYPITAGPFQRGFVSDDAAAAYMGRGGGGAAGNGSGVNHSGAEVYPSRGGWGQSFSGLDRAYVELSKGIPLTNDGFGYAGEDGDIHAGIPGAGGQRGRDSINGGAGGFPGGGGGIGTVSATTSSRGGKGGNGAVVIVSYFD